MDFSRVELSEDDQAFLDDARKFLRTHVTEEVLRRDRETGDNFDEGVHLALGAAGYLEREWKPASDGGFSRGRRRIWELEKRRPRAVGYLGHQRPDRAIGPEVRISRAGPRGDAGVLQRPHQDVPGLHRTR